MAVSPVSPFGPPFCPPGLRDELRDAGLLTSRRHGHQVLYERTPLGIAPAVSQPTVPV
ncbi:hypothetical protein [Streptomyces sp. NPDC005407]|uniref:hypothetical protein n=1 Tax=Streptomyces sp. NPDC005407 TaxID=3155340 RepID=UPI0033B3A6C5